MIFRKKKEKKEKRPVSVVDYRISGYEMFRMLFISTIIVLFVGWTSLLLLSLLYALSFLSLLVLLVYGMEADRKAKVKFGRWFLVILAFALFFFAISLNGSNLAYLIGAYGSSLTCPIFAYHFFLRDLEEKKELAEAFGYE